MLKKVGRREKLAQKSREEGEIGSESREKGDLPPCSPPPLVESVSDSVITSHALYWLCAVDRQQATKMYQPRGKP